MRAVVQRVLRAAVRVDGAVVGEINKGLLVFVGVAKEDTPADAAWMARKLCGLRIFPDSQDRMNQSVLDVAGEILAVSQFTIMGDVRKGNRPAFDMAEDPEPAAAIFELLLAQLQQSGLRVATGKFRAHMEVELLNDGPVTILLDSRRLF